MQLDTIPILNLLMTGSRITLLVLLFIYYTFEWKNKPIYARVFGWVMGMASIEAAIEILSILFSGQATPYVNGLNTMIVFTTIPAFGVFSFALVRQEQTATQCFKRLLYHEIGFVIALATYIAGYTDILLFTGIFSIIYSCCVFTHIQLIIRRYNKNLSNSFANTEGRDLHWVSTIMWLLLLLVTIYMVSRYINSIPMNMLFIATSLTLYQIITYKLKHQQPIDTSILTEAEKGERVQLRDNKQANANDHEEASTEQEIMDTDKEYDEDTQFISLEVRDMIGANLHKAIHSEKVYLNADISIRDLAIHIGTNTAYLSYYLNTVLGKRFSTYINDMRIAHAERMLLKEPTMSIEEIAMHSGFNNVTTMQRLFSIRNNCTPSQFRQMNGNQNDTIFTSGSVLEEMDTNNASTPREYRKLLDERFPKFEERMRTQFPKLTKKELVLCSLIVLGYPNTTIAEMLGINENSLNVTRSRLRTKLHLSRTDNLRVMLTQSVTASPVTN